MWLVFNICSGVLCFKAPLGAKYEAPHNIIPYCSKRNQKQHNGCGDASIFISKLA